MIAFAGPSVEGIGITEIGDSGIKLIGAAECSSLPAVQRKVLAVAGGVTFAFANADDRIVPVGTCFYAIVPRLINCECLVGGIDLKVVIPAEPAHSDANCARRELNLNRLVVKIQK
jgi:hypothetical protein